MTIARLEPHPPPPGTAHAAERQVAELRDARVAIGGTRILEGIDLEVTAGEVVGLVGPNGAGKTTLLRLLATLLPLTAGKATVLGADLGGAVPAGVRRRIAFLGHDPALHPSLSLRENLRLLGGRWDRADGVEAALEVVGLDGAGHRLVARCSRGMVRRAEIARALLIEPRLLLLDEAHAGLDLASAGLVQFLLDDVSSRGGAAVAVSHDVDRLEPAVSRLVTLEAGRIRAGGA